MHNYKWKNGSTFKWLYKLSRSSWRYLVFIILYYIIYILYYIYYIISIAHFKMYFTSSKLYSEIYFHCRGSGSIFQKSILYDLFTLFPIHISFWIDFLEEIHLLENVSENDITTTISKFLFLVAFDIVYFLVIFL